MACTYAQPQGSGGGQRRRCDWPCVYLCRYTIAILGSFQTLGRLSTVDAALEGFAFAISGADHLETGFSGHAAGSARSDTSCLVTCRCLTRSYLNSHVS